MTDRDRTQVFEVNAEITLDAAAGGGGGGCGFGEKGGGVKLIVDWSKEG